jgi:hypothetical protein
MKDKVNRRKCLLAPVRRASPVVVNRCISHCAGRSIAGADFDFVSLSGGNSLTVGSAKPYRAGGIFAVISIVRTF